MPADDAITGMFSPFAKTRIHHSKWSANKATGSNIAMRFNVSGHKGDKGEVCMKDRM